MKKEIKLALLAIEASNIYDFVPQYSDVFAQKCVDEGVCFKDKDYLKSMCDRYEGYGIDRLQEYICGYAKELIKD